MSNWSAGYVADIDYTYGYYSELNPLRSKFALLNSGLVFPEFSTACELGFGQGLSTNIHAAASNAKWYGTDFNPSMAGFAQELANHSKSGAKLFDESFEEFCNRKDLPDFDFIGLHGIWSWVSDDNRRRIVEFIRRKLKVGGIVYVSYNTLPGWAAFAPMRHLMTQHAEIVGSTESGIIGRVDGAISFAEKLIETDPIYTVVNPIVKDRISKLKDQNRHYLAHEYFNRDWEPMHFSTMAKWLEPAKLDFACSAHYLDQLDAINLSPEQINFLNDITDPMLRQSVRDFMINNQFRKDYWIRGNRRLSAYEQSELLRNFRVILCVPRDGIELKVTGARGEAQVHLEIYDPILDALSDNTAKSIEQILTSLPSSLGIGYNQVVQCMLVLMGSGYVAAVQSEKLVSTMKKKTDALNAHLMEKTKGGADINILASPVTGGGVSVNLLQQHFILATKKGLRKPEDLAKATWEHLSIRGQKLLKNGQELSTDDENLTQLIQDAKKFIESEHGLLKTLQIV